MSTLLVVGAGLFGSQAAAYARAKGYPALVFDPGLPGAASAAAAGLFKEEWAGKKLKGHYANAVPLLERLYGIRQVELAHGDGAREHFLCVSPTVILETTPLRPQVTAVGDGWLEADGKRYDGWLYIAAGIWSGRFLPGLNITCKAGTAFGFAGEQQGRIHTIARGRQAIAFARDPGMTYFSDGTAEIDYTPLHETQTFAHAAAMGLTNKPAARWHGLRPYTPGGPLFQKLGARTWLATGGRKMGTIMGASFARRLVEEELRGIMG
jgi:glycine/D-amino acid oxidase-like deaminating enzyme